MGAFYRRRTSKRELEGLLRVISERRDAYQLEID